MSWGGIELWDAVCIIVLSLKLVMCVIDEGER